MYSSRGLDFKTSVRRLTLLLLHLYIRIGNKPYFNKQMFDSGIRHPHDIIQEDGSLLQYVLINF
jgi:hypothetical protein